MQWKAGLHQNFPLNLLWWCNFASMARGTYLDGQKDIQMDRRTHRWTDGHMDGQKDKQMDRRTKSKKIVFVNKKNFLSNFLNIFFDSSLPFYMQIIYSEFHLIWSSGFREKPRTTYRESDIRLLLYRYISNMHLLLHNQHYCWFDIQHMGLRRRVEL